MMFSFLCFYYLQQQQNWGFLFSILLKFGIIEVIFILDYTIFSSWIKLKYEIWTWTEMYVWVWVYIDWFSVFMGYIDFYSGLLKKFELICIELDWILIYLYPICCHFNSCIELFSYFNFSSLKQKKSLTKNMHFIVCMRMCHTHSRTHTVYIDKMWFLFPSHTGFFCWFFSLMFIRYTTCTKFTFAVFGVVISKLLKKENWPPQCVCLCN